jgi:uncharacterized membrane-anchored protein
MQILRRSLFVPLHYWRTILLVSCVGLFVAEAFRDEVAVMLCTLACAFVFTDHERRRWISVSPHFQMGDILLRLSLALSLSYWLAQHIAR